jgi:hypothetical protein
MKLNSLFRNREGKREGLVRWGFEVLVYPTFQREKERKKERERELMKGHSLCWVLIPRGEESRES